jgi:hypothetical protein
MSSTTPSTDVIYGVDIFVKAQIDLIDDEAENLTHFSAAVSKAKYDNLDTFLTSKLISPLIFNGGAKKPKRKTSKLKTSKKKTSKK